MCRNFLSSSASRVCQAGYPESVLVWNCCCLGTLVPDKILLPLPKWSDRERAPYVLPGFLKDNDFAGRIVEVIDAARDWGPGTKLLGALRSIPDSCHLIVADDDVRYKPIFLEGIVNAQRRDKNSSFSYYTYNLDGLTIGQGCDGFSFYSPNLDRILPFAEKHVMGTKLFYHDDFWISFFLASKGISVEAVGGSDNGSLIYDDEFIDGGSLRFLDGSFLRDAIQREAWIGCCAMLTCRQAGGLVCWQK